MADEISQAPGKEPADLLSLLEEDEKARLFQCAMQGEWEKVIEMYKNSPSAQGAIITRSKETALHLAISDAPSNVAVQLIDLIFDTDILSYATDEGDTPLHLAAELGMIKVCKLIADKNKNVITIRNQKGETPIFLAALNGRENTFLSLINYFSFNTTDQIGLFKRKDGITVLHVTIAAECFTLAIAIIERFPELINAVNTDGITPLHILASKTNAFEGSTSLGLFDSILYFCLPMEELEVPVLDTQNKERDTSRNEESQNYPGNYETCMSFFIFLEVIIEKLKKKLWLEVFCSSFQDNNRRKNDAENPEEDSSVQGSKRRKIRSGSERSRLWPFVLVLKVLVKALLITLGAGWRITEIQRKKRLRVEVKMVMKDLVERTNMYQNYAFTGLRPTDFNHHLDLEEIKKVAEQENVGDQKKINDQSTSGDRRRTPILIAAKFGVKEMVKKILKKYPVAIRDTDSEGKNVVLLAVQNRQTNVYDFLRKSAKSKEDVRNKALLSRAFSHVDHDGNSALHLAAFPCDKYRPRRIPGTAFQMQWEVAWFQYVKQSVPNDLISRQNINGQTADEIFVEKHSAIREEGSQWLIKTCESCSVVAALVAGVAFSAIASVPGGLDEKKGTPTLEQKPAFNFFSISSLVALCSSITALVFFLSILTSRYQDRDFAKDLPRKLLLGLTTLFASIAAMLVSFCSGHLFILSHGLRYIAYPLYAGLCFPVTFFAFSQLHLYFDIFWSIFRKVPHRGHGVRV